MLATPLIVATVLFNMYTIKPALQVYIRFVHLFNVARVLGSSYFDNTIDMAFSASKHVHISCMYAVHDTVYIYIVPYIYHVLAVILCTLTAYCYQKLNRNNSGALVRLISRFVHYLLYVCVSGWACQFSYQWDNCYCYHRGGSV